MNWEAIAAVAEALGAAGVIVSLLYLSVQIRANTRTVKNASYQAVVNSINDWGAKVSTNRETAEIWIRGSESFAELDPTERLRFAALAADVFSKFGIALIQNRQGLVRESTIEIWSRALQGMVSTAPGILEWWNELGQHTMEPEVQAYIDRLIHDSQ